MLLALRYIQDSRLTYLDYAAMLMLILGAIIAWLISEMLDL